MSISVLGAGAFGTSLAIALARKSSVTLWARNLEHTISMEKDRENRLRLPDAQFPDTLKIVSILEEATDCQTILIAIPMQLLAGFLDENVELLANKKLVACCKGIDRATGCGPVDLIKRTVPTAHAAILTGPSFAADIARGLPTALTVACADADTSNSLQTQLSTPALRLYRTTDIVGAQLGGALKNVIAIASGIAIGAGLGESARAALMTRGFAEMNRFAAHFGALPQTLAGLSGFGDLTLTCTSELSRNYRYGLALGADKLFDKEITVEGAATALAVHAICQKYQLEMPITQSIAAILENKTTVPAAMELLLSRPLKEE